MRQRRRRRRVLWQMMREKVAHRRPPFVQISLLGVWYWMPARGLVGLVVDCRGSQCQFVYCARLRVRKLADWSEVGESVAVSPHASERTSNNWCQTCALGTRSFRFGPSISGVSTVCCRTHFLYTGDGSAFIGDAHVGCSEGGGSL